VPTDLLTSSSTSSWRAWRCGHLDDAAIPPGAPWGPTSPCRNHTQNQRALSRLPRTWRINRTNISQHGNPGSPFSVWKTLGPLQLGGDRRVGGSAACRPNLLGLHHRVFRHLPPHLPCRSRIDPRSLHDCQAPRDLNLPRSAVRCTSFFLGRLVDTHLAIIALHISYTSSAPPKDRLSGPPSSTPPPRPSTWLDPHGAVAFRREAHPPPVHQIRGPSGDRLDHALPAPLRLPLVPRSCAHFEHVSLPFSQRGRRRSTPQLFAGSHPVPVRRSRQKPGVRHGLPDTRTSGSILL